MLCSLTWLPQLLESWLHVVGPLTQPPSWFWSLSSFNNFHLSRDLYVFHWCCVMSWLEVFHSIPFNCFTFHRVSSDIPFSCLFMLVLDYSWLTAIFFFFSRIKTWLCYCFPYRAYFSIFILSFFFSLPFIYFGLDAFFLYLFEVQSYITDHKPFCFLI